MAIDAWVGVSLELKASPSMGFEHGAVQIIRNNYIERINRKDDSEIYDSCRHHQLTRSS